MRVMVHDYRNFVRFVNYYYRLLYYLDMYYTCINDSMISSCTPLYIGALRVVNNRDINFLVISKSPMFSNFQTQQ